MNDQVILSVTKRGGGLEVTTRGTGHDQLAAMCGYREPGHVVDKLVREKMLELNGGKHRERNEN